MKVCLISRGRTRSTVVVNSLAEQFNIVNLEEIYFKAQHEIKQNVDHRKAIDWNLYIPIFNSKVSAITRQLLEKQSFVCKIFPSMLISPPMHIIKNSETLDDIKQRIIFNLEEYLVLSQYDKVYFLERNLPESAISWVYSNKTGVYHKYKNKPNHYKPIKLNEVDYARARFYVLEFLLQQKIKEFLQQKSIPFTVISENNFEDILNGYSNTIEKTPVNYKELIANADDLIAFVEKIHNEYSVVVQDWQYI